MHMDKIIDVKTQEELLKQANEFFCDENNLAKAISIVIRNNMEDFHCKHLSDEQMKELNPIIRNSIYSALKTLADNPSFLYVYSKMFIPTYWEDCKYIPIE